MIGNPFHHHLPHPRHHHVLRLLIVALLALFAYLLITETAAADSEGVLVLSSEFELKRYTVYGEMEIKVEESEAACRCLRQAVTSAADAHSDLQVVSLPEMDAGEQEAVDEHVALLSTIIGNIRFMEETSSQTYARKSALGTPSLAMRDYSIGEGLAFLAERTGAHKALIVTGWHVAPSGGRVALGILVYGALPPELGTLSVAMADLETGRVSWFSSTREVYDGLSYSMLGEGRSVDNKVVTDPALAEAMFRDLLASYHGEGDVS